MPLRYRTLIVVAILSFIVILISPIHADDGTISNSDVIIGTQASDPVIAEIIPNYLIPPSTTTTIPPTTTTTRLRVVSPTTTIVEEPVAVPAGSVEEMIIATFGSEGNRAIQVAKCESGLNPAARSGQYMGLFQLGNYHRARAARLGFTWDQMLQAGPNIAVAYDLWQEQGWGPWSCKRAIH